MILSFQTNKKNAYLNILNSQLYSIRPNLISFLLFFNRFSSVAKLLATTGSVDMFLNKSVLLVTITSFLAGMEFRYISSLISVRSYCKKNFFGGLELL